MGDRHTDPEKDMTTPFDYIREGADIYRKSFAIIRREGELSRFNPAEERVAVRIIHACGMVDIAEQLHFSTGAAQAGIEALEAGAPILCDVGMLAQGITRSRLPKQNAVICTLNEPKVAALAAELATTRSAAALELWRPYLSGAVIAIGNAPTALFRLLEMLRAGASKPAVILGMPVGFVGAVESKHALMETDLCSIVVHGRQGGSAMTAAAVNALASAAE